MGFATVFESERIVKQFEKFMGILETTFKESNPDRFEKLSKLYEDYQERICTAPASGKIHFHNAYEGGYLDHVLNVYECAIQMAKLYKQMGGILDFTKEELVFAALHHDLGKLGTLENPYYVPQMSEWHREKRNELFSHNENAQYMTVNDRTIFILQQYGVTVSENEYLGMRLTDGLYDDTNKKYLQQYGAGNFPMRTNLHKILHWADHMAASIENDPIRQKMTGV